MPTTPTVELCDDLVTYLKEQVAIVAPDSATRAYFARTADAENAVLQLGAGRRVTVAPSLPNAYTYEPITRGSDRYEHRVSVLIERRYAGAGDPPNDWLDAEIDWVYTNVVLGFDFDKRSDNGPTFNRQLNTLSADVQLFDLDQLLSSKLFSSQVDLTFEELVSA